jgi:hypothetical protein
VKTRSFPDRLFYGVVSKIGGEAELDSNQQRSYRVELTIQNKDGLLRPEMTVFAHIDLGRHMIAWLATRKLRQVRQQRDPHKRRRFVIPRLSASAY